MYCPECKKELLPEAVTRNNKHDLCGTDVIPIDSVSVKHDPHYIHDSGPTNAQKEYFKRGGR